MVLNRRTFFNFDQCHFLCIYAVRKWLTKDSTNMKRLATVILVIISVTVWGQKTDQPTNDFVVTGQIKKELKFTLADIEKYTSKAIGDVVISSHLGEPRGTAKQMTGILVKDLLKDLELQEETPKRFSEFYLTFDSLVL